MARSWSQKLPPTSKNFAAVFVSVLILKIAFTPLAVSIFPADALIATEGLSAHANAASNDTLIAEDTLYGTTDPNDSSPLEGIEGEPSYDAFGRLPDGGKYVDFFDSGNGTMPEGQAGVHIDLTDGLGAMWSVTEWVDGQLVLNETFRGEDPEGQYHAETGQTESNKKGLRLPWKQAALSENEIFNYIRSGQRLAAKSGDIRSSGSRGQDTLGKGVQRDRAPFSSAALADWTSSDIPLDDPLIKQGFPPLKRALESLTVGSMQIADARALLRPQEARRQIGTLFNTNSRQPPYGMNFPLKWLQNISYLPFSDQARAKEPPTNGELRAIYNPRDGVIIVQTAKTLADQNRLTHKSQEVEKLPTLQHLSDVMYMQWDLLFDSARSKPIMANYWHHAMNDQHLAMSLANVQDSKRLLKYLVMATAEGPEEFFGAVQTCVGARGYRNGRVPFWDDRQTFQVGHWCFYTLLAFPISQEFAWLLIKHKSAAALGEKHLSSVTIFWGDDDEDEDQSNSNADFIFLPILIWEVADLTPEVIDLKAMTLAVEQHWLYPGNYGFTGDDVLYRPERLGS